MSSAVAAPPSLFAMLAFNPSNQLAVRRLGSKKGLAFTGSDLALAVTRLDSAVSEHTSPDEYFSSEAGGRHYRVFFTQVRSEPRAAEIEFCSLDTLAAEPATLAP